VIRLKIVLLLQLAIMETAQCQEAARKVVDEYMKPLECAVVANLMGEQDTYLKLLEITGRKIDSMIILYNSGDKYIISFFGLMGYDIINRDFILGFGFGRFYVEIANDVRIANKTNGVPGFQAIARSSYENQQCYKLLQPGN
jgi:hypothetical protein